MKGQLNHLPYSDFIESNPMKHEGKCEWTVGETDITVYFDYFRQHGTLYVTEIEYVSPVAVMDEELKEAVMDTLGPCQFDDTEILRS